MRQETKREILEYQNVAVVSLDTHICKRYAIAQVLPRTRVIALGVKISFIDKFL
ncbi:hypothetical protein [Nostoc sp. 106C]|uniref:hypothetical protein n=1 Tax=Nostoc sp. 106C TaxID=1932667 RepID=UPI00141241BA|nr:hypothetical protein [Nostoc sp. 106C]